MDSASAAPARHKVLNVFIAISSLWLSFGSAACDSGPPPRAWPAPTVVAALTPSALSSRTDQYSDAPVEGGRHLRERAGEFHFAGPQPCHLAEQRGLHLIRGIVAGVDRAEQELAQIGGDDGGAVVAHQHHRMVTERPGERAALLRLDHQHVGVAELVGLVPERRLRSHRRAEMEHGDQINAGDAERHDGGRMMVDHRVHVGPRLVNATVDHALGIEGHRRRADRLRSRA